MIQFSQPIKFLPSKNKNFRYTYQLSHYLALDNWHKANEIEFVIDNDIPRIKRAIIFQFFLRFVNERRTETDISWSLIEILPVTIQ